MAAHTVGVAGEDDAAGRGGLRGGARGAEDHDVAVDDLRGVVSDVDEQAACGRGHSSAGSVDSSTPPDSGSCAAVEHGTATDMSVAT